MKRTISLLALLLGCSPADFSLAAELPVETFFRNYQYSEVRLSPNGQYLATLAPSKKRVGLVVINLKDRVATWAYGNRTGDVDWFGWASNDRLVLRLSKDGYIWPGLVAVNRDGTRQKELIGMRDRRTRFLTFLPHSPEEMLVTSTEFSISDPETGLHLPNVERMNLFSGYMTREVTNPGQVLVWKTDQEGRVRIGLALEGTKVKILYRANTNAAWGLLAAYNYNEDGIDPVGFGYDSRTLYVTCRGGEQTEGVYSYDLEERKIKDLGFRHAEADVGRLIFSSKKRALIGVTYHTERPQIYWFDGDFKKMQASVDLALPNTLNVFVSRSWDATKIIVQAVSDRTPGTFYLLNAATLKMEKLFDLAEWIHADEMAEMKPIEYVARDGLKIHGYLTLPKGSNGKNLPMVVNPHGGPQVRNTWGFDPEVQFFANRGYAVLRMNFRGSPGYGKAFLEAGYKQWGLKQQDDITDGVKWAIAEGIADPKRICIYGASYGGFAALTGLEQTPELYRCGISYAGVTEIIRTMKRLIPDIPVAKMVAAETIGDPKKEKERLVATSPLNYVDKIQVPVFLAYGRLDPRVPIGTGQDLAKALKKRGKLYDFMVKDDEQHGFHKQENKIEFYQKVDEFLKANMQ